MIWHPLTLGIWLLDGLGAVFYLAAAARLLVLLPAWDPTACDRLQLNRERVWELVAYQGRWILALQAISLILLVGAISNLWPSSVPGAMCGLGVMQAMGAAGDQTLFLRLALLALLYAWHVLVRIEQRHPLHQTVVPAGRLLLMAGPLIAAAAWTLGRALLSVQPDHPVSCCATVYARTGLAAPSLDLAWHSVNWALPAGLGAGTTLLHGANLWFRPAGNRFLAHRLPAVLTLLWLPLAFVAVKFKTAPYLLEVLFHPCPWCLLLTDHGAVGFALFGALVWIGAQTIAALVAGTAARRYPGLQEAARARRRRAGMGIVFSTLLFLVLAALPALTWRLRFGGWMT